MTNLSDVRDVIRGALASLFGFGGRLVARAILMIFAGRMYGMEALGLLGLVAAVSEITASVSVLGLKRSLLDMLSFKAENGDRPEPRILNAIVLALCLSAVFITIGACIYWALSNAGVTGALELEKLWPYFLVAIPAYVFSDVALTSIKFKRIIRWDVLARAIAEPWMFLALTISFYYLGFKENGLLIAYSGSVLTAAVCAAIGVIHTYGAKPLLSSKIRPGEWLSILKQSAPIGITDASIMALRRIDLAVLYMIAGPQASGLYYMVQQVATIPQKVQGLFEPMMSPVIARLHNRKNGDGIRSNLIAVCRWIFIIQLGLTIPMILFGDKLLALFGTGFAAGALVLTAVLIAELINGTFLTAETALIFEKPKIPPLLLIATLIIEVCVIAFLADQWGALGAAIGFLVALIFLALMRIGLLYKHMGIWLVTRGYLWPVAIGAIVAGGLFLARRHLEPISGIWTIGLIVVGLFGFAGLIRTFALTKSDDIIFRAFKRKRNGTNGVPT